VRLALPAVRFTCCQVAVPDGREVGRLKVRQQCCAPSHSVAEPVEAPTPGNSSSRHGRWLKSLVATGFCGGDGYARSVL